MPDPKIGKFLNPQALAHLTSGRGWNSELVGFLSPFARKDFLYKEWDFLETAVTDNPGADWTLTKSDGTSDAVYTTVANAEDGRISADTGTSDNGGVAITFDSVMFDAAMNPGMDVIMQIDDVSEAANEISFSDAYTDPDTIAITDVDTPTKGNGATDGVWVLYDTDQTLKANALVAGGTTDTAAKVNLFGTAATVAGPFVNATDFTVVLQAYANSAYAIINDDLSLSGGLAVGPDTAVLMAPKIVTITRNATAKFPQIDLIRIWANRRGA